MIGVNSATNRDDNVNEKNYFFMTPYSHLAEMPGLANPLNSNLRKVWASSISLFTKNAKTSILGKYRFVGEIYCAPDRSRRTVGQCLLLLFLIMHQKKDCRLYGLIKSYLYHH